MLERHYKRHGNFTPTKLLNRFHEHEVPHDYFDYQDFDTNGESNQAHQEQKQQLNLKLESASSGGEIFNKLGKTKPHNAQFPTKLLLDHQAKNYKRMVDTLAKERLRIKNLQKKISVLAGELENVQTDTVEGDVLDELDDYDEVAGNHETLVGHAQTESQTGVFQPKPDSDTDSSTPTENPIEQLKSAISKQIHVGTSSRNFQNRFVFPKNRTIKKISLPDGINHDFDEKEDLQTRNVTVYEKVLNWECPFDYPAKKFDVEAELQKINSILNVRKDKFLLNLSPFGPNNQFRGFRDTVILAYYLNRTIVLPLFFKHQSDPSLNPVVRKHEYQNATEKLDVFSLKKLMNVITFSQFSKECEKGIDMTLFARRNTGGGSWLQLKAYQHRSKIEMTKLQTIREFNKNPKISEINIFPRKDGVNKFTQGAQNGNEQISILPTNYSVQAAYGPEKVGADPKCVLWMQPFRNLMWEHAVSTKQNFTGRRDANIIRKMVLSTTRPKSVQKTARLWSWAIK